MFVLNRLFSCRITLDPCTIELDITIVDRICAVLNPQPVCVITRPQNSIWGKPPPSSTNSQQEIRIDTKVVCSDLTLKLRYVLFLLMFFFYIRKLFLLKLG